MGARKGMWWKDCRWTDVAGVLASPSGVTLAGHTPVTPTSVPIIQVRLRSMWYCWLCGHQPTNTSVLLPLSRRAAVGIMVNTTLHF